MKPSTLRRIALSLATIGLPLAIAILFFTSNLGYYTGQCDRFGDYPLIALDISRATNWRALIGAYSRHGFNHPGPFTLYWYAAVSPVFFFISSEYGRYSLAQLLLNTILLSGSMSALRRFLGVRASILGFATALSILTSSSEISFLTDIWGPATLPCATLAFITCSASLWAASLHCVFPWALAIVILLSNHLGTWPVIVPIALCITIRTTSKVYKRGEALSPSERASIVGSIVIFIAAATPPLIEALTSPDFGNIGKILAFTRNRTGAHAWSEVLPYIESFFNVPLGESHIQGRFIVAMAILCILGMGGDYRAFIAPLLGVTIAITILTIPGALHIRGGLHPFICWHLYGCAATLYSVGLVGITERLERTRSPQLLSVSRLLAICCTIIALGVSIRSKISDSCISSGVYEYAVTQLSPRSDTIYVLETRDGHVPWQHYAQIAYALSRRGVSFCVSQRWEFMYGLDHSCRRLLRETGSISNSRTLQLVSKSAAPQESLVNGIDVGPFFVVEGP